MTRDAFGIYVHIPYCVRKCPYCDFNSFAVGKSGTPREDAYCSALEEELRASAEEEVWRGRTVSSVYFGGGTPSLLSSAAIHRLLRVIRSEFTLSGEAEVTLEANPGTVQELLGLEKLTEFRGAGVNRLSLGVQSFSDRKLRLLDRIHSGADAAAAVGQARAARFENVSLDLMFGLRGETAEEWDSDLERAVNLGPEHLSVYSLTLEPGTMFYRWQQRGEPPQADEEVQARLFVQAQERLNAAGYRQYEISNYARPDRESRHNSRYWSGGDYLGVGAGAHGFCAALGSGWGTRWANERDPEQYRSRIEREFRARAVEETLTKEQAEMEYLFLRLRCRDGIDLRDYAQRFGSSLESRAGEAMKRLADQGLLRVSPERLALSDRGFLFLDSVLNELV